MKTLKELVNLDEPGMKLIKEWSKDAKNSCEFLPCDEKRAENELLALQVTTRSPMGALVYGSGGLVINNGWMRIFGSGCEKMKRGIVSFNQAVQENFSPFSAPYLLIADDVLGGNFAINAGGLGKDAGKIYYLAQDTLEWQGLNVGYSEFLDFAFNGNLAKFYEGFFFENWQEEVAMISLDEVFAFMPFLWTKEGANINSVSKRAVSAEENFRLTLEFMQNLKR
ncbi:DUF2625 domain-containing protein [Campylobacter sp. RM16187]|uniref:DUF2625 domain-containing protein n=1 Tax=Campylobacter sp. RM16187 TaxID=1660063 RepID=UPI0021B6AEA6|nr:DUF2625 domain-containing protein [Campylobacter sp. RM16187]QKG28400.1 putative DUF2625 domain protein [Campylobacter sp. RM16187]